MSHTITEQVETLNLGNIHPTINQQFEDAIERLVEDFADESEKGERGIRTGVISLKITIKHNLETRATSIEAKLDLKAPGYRAIGQAVRLPRGGAKLLVEIEDATQLALYAAEGTP